MYWTLKKWIKNCLCLTFQRQKNQEQTLWQQPFFPSFLLFWPLFGLWLHFLLLFFPHTRICSISNCMEYLMKVILHSNYITFSIISLFNFYDSLATLKSLVIMCTQSWFYIFIYHIASVCIFSLCMRKAKNKGRFTSSLVIDNY